MFSHRAQTGNIATVSTRMPLCRTTPTFLKSFSPYVCIEGMEEDDVKLGTRLKLRTWALRVSAAVERPRPTSTPVTFTNCHGQSRQRRLHGRVNLVIGNSQNIQELSRIN